MKGGTRLLRMDTKGRVRTPAAKREEILDEFGRSGLSGVRFAELAGIKYSTLASWLRRGRLAAAEADPVKPVRFLEAMVEKAAASSAALEVELPGGVRLRIGDAGQIPLAVQPIRAWGRVELRVERVAGAFPQLRRRHEPAPPAGSSSFPMPCSSDASHQPPVQIKRGFFDGLLIILG